MARISRKKTLLSTPDLPQETGIRNTGIYARLSVEDNGKNSDSIESQIAILEAYVRSNPSLRKTEVYIDNGYTGTNFLRPAFSRMMKDVQAGKIRCVVVKDLSRLGRAYIETSEFIEKICPFFDLRFISVNDGFDSEYAQAQGNLSVSLSNIINDYYAKDISRKAATALRAKMERGDFIANYAPYGYMKDPQNKNRLLIDPVAAMIVRQIFEWRAEGMSYMGINKRLNQAGVPSPGQHRLECGIETHNNKKSKTILWNKHVVTDILYNIAYVGHLAQGKGNQKLYAGIPPHRTREDEWIVSKDTHEAIVDVELFERVQQINREVADNAKSNVGKYDHLPKEKNIFGKRFTCACCGAVMKLQRSFSTKRDKVYYTYKCPTYAEHGKLGCFDVKMRKVDLDEAVLSLIQMQMRHFLDVDAQIKRLEKERKQSESPDRHSEIMKLKTQLEKKQRLFSGLYADLKDGLLTVDDYKLHKASIAEEIERLKAEILLISGQKEDEQKDERMAWRTRIEHFLNENTLTEELVQAMIASVRINEKGELDIEMSFADELQSMRDACEEVA